MAPNDCDAHDRVGGRGEHQQTAACDLNDEVFSCRIMISMALAYARYWRNTLADAELGRGAFRSREVEAFQRIDAEALARGRFGEDTLAALFQGDNREAESLKVVLRPLVYRSRTEHGRSRVGSPDFLTPIATPATVFRDGRLELGPGTATPRDLLEPIGGGGLTIGAVDALDAFLTGEDDANSAPRDWQSYREFCGQLIKAVCPDLARDDRFERMDYGFLELAQGAKGASQHIGALYDRLREEAPDSPLFETFAAASSPPIEPCLPDGAGFSARLRHASPRYPLARAQRGALAHLLAARHGEVVAVNGPPGTGKTTLLLSVIASLWADAALRRDEPPVMFAASTNNQAVTNIIDAFGSDFAMGEGVFAGRWLPDVMSFAGYFPAASRRGEAAVYQTQSFFDRIEDAEYLGRARTAFLNAAAVAFPDLPEPTVEAAVEALHQRLQAQTAELAAIETGWLTLCSAREATRALLGESPADGIAALYAQVEEAVAECGRASSIVEAWDRHLASEPLLHALLTWLPAVARRRLYHARQMLRPLWPALPEQRSLADIALAISRRAEDARRTLSMRQADLGRAEAVLGREEACLEHWRAVLRPLGVSAEDAAGHTLAQCDADADRLLRFPIFLTTTHYWEGRWLLDMANVEDIAKEKGRKGRRWLEARWRRRMKLTPCVVSTFHMLPDLLRGRRHEDDRFVDDYLYDFADLLIVDEAGQATPEVAGAAFSLARRALVIGDTAQIPPIWSIPGRVDVGNLMEQGLLTPDDRKAGRNPVRDSGRAAASGSVMQVAQTLSRYHQAPDLARGLMLDEHRRCFDEIVSYCNALCYRGKLRPLRGRKADTAGGDGLPPLGYIHIDGCCETDGSGSRRNLAEADAIAAWLMQRRKDLETVYPGRPLGDIVGVVTPFGAQVRAIRSALQKAGVSAGSGGELTVGSVHAFQGGQRPVMLFSPTYSKHADGDFIDRDPSMLNVAVSRAMNSFIVFGDMDLFSAAPRSSPRGLLGDYLFADETNRLAFEQAPRQDLMRRGKVEHLRDTAAHDAFLRGVLADVQRELHIVSPWITRQALEQTRLGDYIAAASARGVRISVYTDRALNTDRSARTATGRDDLQTVKAIMTSAGVEVIEVRDVHSKIVMADNDLYCVGSFNWLSAARDGAYARHETSIAYRSLDVIGEIEAMKMSLSRRAIGAGDGRDR